MKRTNTFTHNHEINEYKTDLLIINDNVRIRTIRFNKAHIIVVIITLIIKEGST